MFNRAYIVQADIINI